MADQCIICLEDLDVSDAIVAGDLRDAGGTLMPVQPTTHPGKSANSTPIALIEACGHVLHDDCLKLWSQKANSCPICRKAFNLVQVLDKVGGIVTSEYDVENKKQVAEFDPNDFLEDESNEPEEETPCLVCNLADQEDVLLLCDGCNSPYHTHCLNMDRVPRGNWFCIECEDEGASTRARELAATSRHQQDVNTSRPSRTLHSQRQIRQRMRNDDWLGSWNRVSSRIHDVAGLDLDFSEDDNEMYNYRRIQRRTEQSQRQFREWQSRLLIAGRQGAGEEFRRAVPLDMQENLPQLDPEESKAWGAFERAKELDTASSRNRKRKSRSATASPTEPLAEPQRKLKRPRTRRVVDKVGSPSASPTIAGPSRPPNSRRHVSPPSRTLSDTNGEPSFLSSLLKEVEMPTSDDDTSRSAFSATTAGPPTRVTSPPLDFSSPAASPSPPSSTYHTPRALSITPPPHISKRPGSPLSLTSRIEANFPPSGYSPNRSTPEIIQRQEDLGSTTTELRQPRPQRRHPVALPRSEEVSPVRATMSAEAKEGINRIVKNALGPHWKAAEITKEQYADINRDVSRKLYEIVADRSTSDERHKVAWEKFATAEVATAVQSLTTAAL